MTCYVKSFCKPNCHFALHEYGLAGCADTCNEISGQRAEDVRKNP